MDEVYGRTLWREHSCQTCKQPFKASRIDAQYCSPRCRQYWKRHGSPYPTRGTPVEVGPGLFDEVPNEPEPIVTKFTEMLHDEIKAIDAVPVTLTPKIKAKKSQVKTKKVKPKPRTKKGAKKNGKRHSK